MRSLLLILVFLFVLPASACQAHEVGGKTSKEVFSDKNVRKLADAACVGDVKKINRLIEKGVNVDGEGYKKTTPLLWTLSCENYEGIEALLNQGADPNHEDSKKRTPFIFSVSYDDPRFFKLMLESGGNVNAVFGSVEETILMTAFRSGVYDKGWSKYYMLLDAGADIDYITSDRKFTLAMYAMIVFARHCKVQELMDAGHSTKLNELLGYVESQTLAPEFPDSKCQDELIQTIKARIAQKNASFSDLKVKTNSNSNHFHDQNNGFYKEKVGLFYAIEDKAHVIQSKHEKELLKECMSLVLSSSDLNKILEQSQAVSSYYWNSALFKPPCFFEGTIKYKNNKYNFVYHPTGFLNLQDSTGNTQKHLICYHCEIFPEWFVLNE